MPTEQYNPLAGGRGLGRSRLYAAMGKEKAFEAKRYEEELTAAEDAARKETEGASAWQGIGSTLAAVGTFLTTGGDIKSTAKAWQWGGEAGKWGHRLVSGYDPEDYALSTDMGTFDVSKGADIEEINRDFEEAQNAQFWKDITGTGATLLTLGGMKSTGIDWLDKWMSPVVQNEGAAELDLLHQIQLKGPDIGIRPPRYLS